MFQSVIWEFTRWSLQYLKQWPIKDIKIIQDIFDLKSRIYCDIITILAITQHHKVGTKLHGSSDVRMNVYKAFMFKIGLLCTKEVCKQVSMLLHCVEPATDILFDTVASFFLLIWLAVKTRSQWLGGWTFGEEAKPSDCVSCENVKIRKGCCLWPWMLIYLFIKNFMAFSPWQQSSLGPGSQKWAFLEWFKVTHTLWLTFKVLWTFLQTAHHLFFLLFYLFFTK